VVKPGGLETPLVERPFVLQVAVHPELQMVLILRPCPFPQLLEGNCRTSVIALEQVKHRLRLL
jgi:hypothetical protein